VPWILVDVALVLGSLLLLAVLLLGLWRQVKALGSTMAEAQRVVDGFSSLPVPDPGSSRPAASAPGRHAPARRR
jgi:hypothetical protein